MTSFLPPLQLPSIEAALRDAKSQTPDARWMAAMVLGRETGAQADACIAALTILTQDPIADIRAQALEGFLQQARGSEQHRDLFENALRDTSPGVRCTALDGLGAGLHPPIASIAHMLGDMDPSVRGAAASTLGAIQATDSCDAIADLLTDEDEAVRFDAAAALASLADPRGVPCLIDALGRDGATVRQAAIALGRLQATEAMPHLQQARRRLLLSADVKVFIGLAMVRCGNTAVIDGLIEQLQARKESKRLQILSALAELPVRGISHEVGRRIDEGSEMEQSSAIQTLLELASVDPTGAALELEKRAGKLSGELEEERMAALQGIQQQTTTP